MQSCSTAPTLDSRSPWGPFCPHLTRRDFTPKLYTFTVLNATDAKSLRRRSGGTNLHSKSAYQRFFPENAQRHFIQKALHPQTQRREPSQGPFPRNLVYVPPSLVTRTFSKDEFLCILPLKVGDGELRRLRPGSERADPAPLAPGRPCLAGGRNGGWAFPSLRPLLETHSGHTSGSQEMFFLAALAVAFCGDAQVQNPTPLEIQKNFLPQANPRLCHRPD